MSRCPATGGRQWGDPGSLDSQPGPLLLCSLGSGTKMAHGESIGGPGIHGFSWTIEKGVTPGLEPGSGQLQCPPWPCPGY